MKPKKIKKLLKCAFTEEELKEKGKLLANETQTITSLKADKKRYAKEFDARIAESEAHVNTLSDDINTGHFYKDIVCEIRYDKPKKNWIQIVRTDTSEIIETRAMSDDELQEVLDFKEEDATKE